MMSCGEMDSPADSLLSFPDVYKRQVVHSRMSFFSDALGHSAFTGMAIGALCGFSEPTWAAVLFSLVFALLFNFVRRRTRLASDTVIGVFSSTAVALGIFISTLGSRSFTKFNSLLIGDILSVEPGKIGLLALILLLVLALWGLSFNHLMLSAVHPALADSRGVRVFWQEALFSAAIAVVVTVSMTWVGLLVINSLLVLPEMCIRDRYITDRYLPDKAIDLIDEACSNVNLENRTPVSYTHLNWSAWGWACPR